MSRRAAIVLAAGQGTRMLSATPKVLHELAGQSLLAWALQPAKGLIDEAVVIVGHQAEAVAAVARRLGASTALQQPQLGTGHALQVGLEALEDCDGADDSVLVLSGDVPLLRRETLERLCKALDEGAAAALATALLDEPGRYGRVLRDADGKVARIVEAADATPAQLETREVNAGLYAFNLSAVRGALAALRPDNAQGEYYLTDAIASLVSSGLRVDAVVLGEPEEMTGVNTRRHLAMAHDILRRRVIAELMDDGVTIVDPANTWIDPDCEIARDVVIEPGVVIRRGSMIGEGARIGANSVLDNAKVEAGAIVAPLSHLEG